MKKQVRGGTLYHGDCLVEMNDIPRESVDLILCDLPYGTTRCKWDTVVPLDELWQHYTRIAKPNAAIVLTAQTPFDKVLGSSNLKMLKYEWIWEKTAATGHMNAKKMPMKAHENILVFYKKPPKYNPIMTTGHVRKTVKTRRSPDSECYGFQDKDTAYDSTERYPRSVLTFPSDKQKISLHPTQKPLALMEYLIRTYTDEGDMVLDNCAGSGTTLVAAEKLGRRWIGIEKESHYFDVAENRILSI